MSRQLLNATKRRKSLYDPTYKLFRTHDFAADETNIATGTVFPDRTKPITVAVTVKRTNTTPSGIILELGSATTGLAIWFAAADSKVYAAAGDATPPGGAGTGAAIFKDGDTVWKDGDVIWVDRQAVGYNGLTLEGIAPPQGQIVRIVFSVIPASGKARLWMNGKLVAHGSAGDTLPNGWSDGSDGEVGGVDTDVTTRVPVADRITLAQAVILSPVTMFHNQRPRQFFEVA